MTLPTHLSTARLTLRPPSASDAVWIAREIAHPDVAPKLTSLPHPYTLGDAEVWLDGLGQNNGQYIVEAGDPIGSVTLKADPDHPELGYWLARGHWGQGYMTEAARAVLAAYFSVRPGPVPSGHVVGNVQSANTLRKLGFENTHIAAQTTPRGVVEVQKMTLTRAAWLNNAQGPGPIPA